MLRSGLCVGGSNRIMNAMRRRLAAASALCALLHAPPASGQEIGSRATESVPGTDVTLAFVYLPGGAFSLGSSPDQPGRDDDEGPVRSVRVGGFWLGIHEVPDEAYAAFRNPTETLPDGVDAVTHPSTPYEDPAHGMGGNGRPAVGMTRLAALHFARWLSLHTGRLYRLPTEAEWEYACRTAGLDEAPLDEHAWTAANAGGRLHEVGGLDAGMHGVYDLLGNAAEWTLDPYREDFYATLPADGTAVDPRSGAPGAARGVVRGGSYLDAPADVRCAAREPERAAWKRRDPQVPKSRWWNTDAPHVGFRLVREARNRSPDEVRAWWNEVLPPDQEP